MQAFLKGNKSTSEKKTTPAKKNHLIPWVEKYRPRLVDEVVEQNEVVSVLKECLSGADLPNLLFYGPPGTGKTSTILAAARQLFGDIYKDRILELNASDERGIQVIRDRVKTFAQISTSARKPDGSSCPPFKIIILDEADSMTHAAQAALRRTMERETKSTRFCLVCNYVSRIIPPLTSRCSKFRFKPLTEDKIKDRLSMICKEENVNCDEETLNKVVETSGGDMRRAITCLQSCARLKGRNVPINKEDVIEITGIIPDCYIQEFLDVCKQADYNQLEKFVDKFILQAYAASQLLEQLNEVVVFSKTMNRQQKAVICEKIGLCSYRLQDGASEFIQLLDLGCCIMMSNKLK